VGSPPPPPPPPGGNVVQATKGGTDTITIGTTNVALLGAKNTVSLGTESSLTASFANKITMGTSLQVNMASDIKWNLNAILGTELVKSVTIDDSDVVTMKKSFSSMARDAVNLSAGASDAAVGNLKLETKLNVLRGAVLGLTALQMAQNAVLGMSVNKSVGETLTPNQWASGLMGWGGIAGTLAGDAVTNVASVALIQACAQTLAEDIKALKNMSRMTLDAKGIVQTVAKGTKDEGSISLLQDAGIKMAARNVEMNGGTLATVKAGAQLKLMSPVLALNEGTTSPRAFIGINSNVSQVLLGTQQSSLRLKGDQATLTSPKINLGYGQNVPDPLYAVLGSQEEAATGAWMASFEAWEQALDIHAQAPDGPARLVAQQAADAAYEAAAAAAKTVDAIRAQRASIDPTKPVPVFNGLAIDSAKTELTHTTATSLKLTSAGAEMTFGAANFKLDAQGLSGAGPLIKLG
jgi:type VI secretion system secreted protein VgrG